MRNSLLVAGVNLDARWLTGSIVILTTILEFSTTPSYVFSYLFIAPILVANSRLSRKLAIQITVLAIVLTIANLWITSWQKIEPASISNRLIAVFALIITFALSDRNRRYAEEIAQTQAQLLAEQELAKVREDFVSTLTHDLKTPLLGAIATLSSLQQNKFGDVTLEQRQVLEIMNKSHRSTLLIVQMLLDVYHNDTNGLELNLVKINLIELAKETISMLTELFSTREIQIRLELLTSISNFWIDGDALQIRRVFINLLSNAATHSLRGGEVLLRFEAPPRYCIVRVIDRGIGIATEDLPHLFERFYQGENDRQLTGSGLGLYLSRQIIEAHGGKIWAENFTDRSSPQDSQHGAIFSFQLPN